MTPSIIELSERMWAGEADLVHEHHPVQYRHPQAEEIADGVLVYIGIASANTIDTGDGLVMLDTGHQLDVVALHEQVRAWRASSPLHAAVYSHHHVDHIFGTAIFEQEATSNGWAQPTVYAHEELPKHFDRYLKTLGWNRAINMR